MLIRENDDGASKDQKLELNRMFVVCCKAIFEEFIQSKVQL